MRCLTGAFLLVLATLAFGPRALADTLVSDDITRSDRYDLAQTTAVVDTLLQEIRLQPAASATMFGLLDSRPKGYEVVTINGSHVESYSFDGVGMVKNQAISLTPGTSPLAVAAASSSTDVVVLSPGKTTAYSFNGEGLAENPYLAVTGLTAPATVQTRPGTYDQWILDGAQIKAFGFNGVAMVYNEALSIAPGLTNPIAFALRPTTYDTVVLENGSARFFGFNGTSLAENPQLAITGLVNPVGVKISESGTVYIAEATGISAYAFNGSGYAANPLLSIHSAAGALGMALLGDPSTVAIRYDTEIRFYSFNGVGMAENRALRISGLSDPGTTAATGRGYASSGVATSRLYDVQSPVEALVLRARQDLPAATSLSFQVSGNAGMTWLGARLGKGVRLAEPFSADGAQWRATLQTSDPTQTPRVLPEVELLQVYRPDRPGELLVVPTDADGLTRSGTPTLSWSFTDPDTPQGDRQSAFQIVIYDRDTGGEVYNTGKVSALPDADPPPDDPGPYPVTAPDWRGYDSTYAVPLGALVTGHRFRWKVRVWDMYDLVSDWSVSHDMEILALTNLRITDLAVQQGETKPPLPSSNLPMPVKAGQQFSFAIDSIGAVTAVSVSLSDGGSQILTPSGPTSSSRNTWSGTYFTAPTLPDGTVVSATFTGYRADGKTTTYASPLVIISGSVYNDFVVILNNN